MRISAAKWPLLLAFLPLWELSAYSGILEYGDEDLCNTGRYGTDPKAGATLLGLAPGVSTIATRAFSHSYPFSPRPGDYAGTDQIYVGSVQTRAHDGYSGSATRVRGPQIISLDYSSIVSPGQTVDTLTLGIGADDFQQRSWHQPFTAYVNGISDPALTTVLNSLNQTGPYEQFFSIGIDPTILNPGKVLTLKIDEGGDGGDGWAIDFLTIGVTARSVPEPGSLVLLSVSLILAIACRYGRESYSGRTTGSGPFSGS